jgi:protein-S-isoprenylcysteine O-methyltransferase Ste14
VQFQFPLVHLLFSPVQAMIGGTAGHRGDGTQQDVRGSTQKEALVGAAPRRERRIMIITLVKLAGLAVTIACWLWALNLGLSETWNAVLLIWCAPLLSFPISVIGRRALDAQPSKRRAEWTDIFVHYTLGVALGAGLFPAFRLLLSRPTLTIPVARQAVWALVMVTGAGTVLTVANLAMRGLGAPFAVKLSSRLATDYLYAWTRNPMILCTFAWFLSLALWHASPGAVLWLGVSVFPGWIFFLKRYEERELEIRFGSSYASYQARTPFLWPTFRTPFQPGRFSSEWYRRVSRLDLRLPNRGRS